MNEFADKFDFNAANSFREKKLDWPVDYNGNYVFLVFTKIY